MNLNEIREKSWLSREMTATKIICEVKEKIIRFGSNYGSAVEFRGFIKSHFQWNGTDEYGMSLDMPFDNLEFVCTFSPGKPKLPKDDEGEIIAGQLLYSPGNSEYAASIKIEVWDQHDSFINILNTTKAALSDTSTSTQLQFLSNVDFKELVESNEISECSWLPLFSWEIFIYNDDSNKS